MNINIIDKHLDMKYLNYKVPWIPNLFHGILNNQTLLIYSNIQFAETIEATFYFACLLSRTKQLSQKINQYTFIKFAL